MGFIENERRRHAAELEAQKKRPPIIEQQKGEQAPIKASLSYEQQKEKERELREKSRQYFEQSGLGEMIAELGRLGSHEKTKISNEYGDNHSVRITLRTNSLGGSDYLRIYTKPDGSIRIIGDISHETTLFQDKWQGKNGQKKLEKALEKAYKHPQSYSGNFDEANYNMNMHGRGGG